MKMLATLLTLVFAVSAFAGHTKKFKTVTHVTPLAIGNGIMTYDKVCQNDNDQLRTINTIEVCVERKWVKRGDDHDSVCVRTETRYGVRDINYEKVVCTKRHNRNDRCLREEIVPATLDTHYFVKEVQYKWEGNHRDGEYRRHKTLSSERFEVPFCSAL